MISVVFSTRKDNQSHIEHIKKTSGIHKGLEVIQYINDGEFSLTEIYNKALKETTNDIVVFLHDDILVESKQWANKLLKTFEKNPEYGIIGVAGTKYLPESGQWWVKPKKMYGRVQHTHNGKTWLSSYSEDLGKEVEEVVIVDGLFFAVDKRKIKETFNESVKGFHFYDVTFCFENYLKDVKVGVITSIRVNHMSIGMTNEQWEENRQQFSETFKEHLPVNIKKTLRKNEKLNVLIGCLSFKDYTGSELYVFELAKKLIKEGCNVSICSNIGDPLSKTAKQLGIKLYTLEEPPGFKLGDGKWVLQTQQGNIVSEPNKIYKVSNIDFDVLHLNHKPITEHLIRLYPETPVICSIHSEVINLEEPVISPQIKKYIAIRPEIKKYIVDTFGINSKDVDVIYNPIDSEKFKVINTTEKRDKKRVLFVGTIDYLRRKTIEDLINTTKENNEELWIVGKENDTYLPNLISNETHVKYFGPTSNVEQYIHKCDVTSSVLLGRTTIEGWMCGKKGWIYDIDSSGNILSKSLHEVPDDIEKFKSDNVVKEILQQYESILD